MAVWTRAYIDDLPDSAFLYVERGGKKDDSGKTVPRSLRHFPYRDKSGAVDRAHLRNALARIPQSKLPAWVKTEVSKKAQTILEEQDAKSTAQSGACIELRAEAVNILQAAADRQQAPRLEILAYSGGLMNVPAWGPVVIDLQGLDVSAAVPILADHDATLRGIVGHGQATVEGGKLFVRGPVAPIMQAGRQVLELAASGFPFGASVGVEPLQRERIEAGGTVSLNNRTIQAAGSGFTLIRRGRLREVSIVPTGADASTSVAVAASRKDDSMNDSENSDNSGTLPDEQLRARAAAEAERLAVVETVCANYATRGFDADKVAVIRAQAIKDGWDRNRTELEFIRAERPSPPVGSYAARPAGPQLLEAALLTHLGHEALGEQSFGATVMQQARDLHMTHALDLVKAALYLEGRQLPVGGPDTMIRAAFSTVGLPGILGNVANKLLLGAYQAFPSAARRVARKLTASDFKEHTGYRVTGDFTLEEVGASGELKHATIGEGKFSYRVGTFGRLFSVTRQSLRNDDLGAFEEVPRAFGRGAALALEELFWTLVLANTGSFFDAENNNYLDGADSELGVTGLGKAVEAFLKQVDADGNPIAVIPRFLVVPPELKTSADELFRSTTLLAVGATETVTRVPSASAFYGLYEPVACPYLSNTNYSGHSGDAWYLFGDPADVPAFGIAYLDGNETPIIEQIDPGPDVLGMGWRAYFDVGVCQIDHRGAVKSKGTI